jgi:protein tyrosine phosphatase (PTP) superfamily phosphohydrolase (DUF442 family)
MEFMTSQDIYNYIKVNDEISTAGQPTAEQLATLSTEGYTTVINLATIDPARIPFDEANLVRSQRIAYHHIPVDWSNPKESDFAEFEQVMSQLPQGRTLIHCAANFRVTAFYSLYAQKQLGWSAAQAEAFRLPVWQGSDYPVWSEFIARIQAQIAGDRE